MATIPTPVPLPTPETIAVYAPGARSVRIADSNAFEGAKPAAVSWAEFAALCQSSFVATTVWSDDRTSVSVGLASAFAMPYCVREGPVTTIATRFAALPPITKPPIITSLPVSTCMRVEMLARRAGSGATKLGAPVPERLTVPAPALVTIVSNPRRSFDPAGVKVTETVQVVAGATLPQPLATLKSAAP